MLLDIARDELGHLRLRALLARLEAHERGELIRQRALHEKSIVRAASLVRLELLRAHVLRVLALLLLAVTGLALGRLDGILNTLDGVAQAGLELGTEGLELLTEGGELNLRRLRGLNHDRGRRGLNGRHRERGGARDGLLNLRGLGLGGSLRGLRGRGGDGGGGCSDDSGDDDGLGIGLLGRHLVCLNDRGRGRHF